MRSFALVALAIGTLQVASAITVYDNFDQWDGSYVNWVYGVGQHFPVPLEDGILKSWRSEFFDMNGWVLDFEIRDEADNGYVGNNVLFSSQVTVPQGGGVVQIDDMNVALEPGKNYYGLWRFPTVWMGPSAHVTGMGTVPGNVAVDIGGAWVMFGSLDLKLTAVFVPEPATVIALGMGAAFFIRRRRK